MDEIRDKRLMVFTSLCRTLDFVSHARVTQVYHLFLEYEKQHPLLDGYTRTGQGLDHKNMREFIEGLK